ncbi:MAG: sugar transferase [Muribaculaceae bacterium]|nr:sugar transferase [Muribaculaceae bacterium]
MISERQQRMKYVIGDFVASNVAWFGYNCMRYLLGATRGASSLGAFLGDRMILLGQIAFPLMMMVVYYLSGYYNNVFRKSRLQELFVTFSSTFVNVIIIFFVALINDMISNERGINYELIAMLFVFLFVTVYAVRMVNTSITSRKIKSRQWQFKTLVVGCGASAFTFVQKMERMRSSLGYDVVGYVEIPHENRVKDIGKPVYSLDEIEEVCAREGVKELIVVPTKQDSTVVLNAINKLFPLHLPIKITPDKYNILLSRVRLSDMYGEPLVDISGSNMTEGWKNLKRAIDVVLSLILLILLIPAYIIIAICIRADSKGCVLFKQERLGMHNKPFKIVKFRSMYDNAEEEGTPQLSTEDDPRITRVGKVLRKYRLDELPQFWNVLKGDMSIVGPRPEREYYANLILEREPAYALVRQIRPGITSMGMVKFGYAKNVDEMVERLRYDLMYLENMSLLNDLKILVYTIKIVFTGRGL